MKHFLAAKSWSDHSSDLRHKYKGDNADDAHSYRSTCQHVGRKLLSISFLAFCDEVSKNRNEGSSKCSGDKDVKERVRNNKSCIINIEKLSRAEHSREEHISHKSEEVTAQGERSKYGGSTPKYRA